MRRHLPREEKDVDIRIEIPYTIEQAYHQVGNGAVDVSGATVIIDLLTNDIRGNSRCPAASPEQLVWRVDQLRGRLREAGAVASVVCQAKPMEVADVTPYNSLLHEHLQAQGGQGFGSRTQVRREFLERDGYHVKPGFLPVICGAYASAILGWPVPNPTPWEEFAPDYVRRRLGAEWPSLGRGNAWGQGGRFEGPRMNYVW